MKQSVRLFAIFMFALCAGILSVAQSFEAYPGALPDEKASRASSAVTPGVEYRVFTSSDSFDKVYAFYRGKYKEFNAPFPHQKLPNGREVKWAFFILDGASDLSLSRSWIKIQRPSIDSVNDEGDFTNVRDISVIETVRKR